MRARRQAGFTYLGLIIFVAIIGLVGAATLKIGSLLQRAAAEEELLEIGAAFSAALDSYAAATPRGASPYPPSLAELLKDPRSPAVRRHLRKVYVDPLTGKAEWGIVFLGDGETGVVAFHSLSDARPLKLANFDSRFKGLDNKEKISEWRFSAGERSLAPAVTTTQSGGPGAQPAPPAPQAAPPIPQPAAPPPPPALEEPAPPEPAEEEGEAVDRE
ncbi:type II secretion system protein [Massilia sp. CFBP9012]|uniref:type II secretion system protein n=1 Tax=Massilia sp. CFBP9012 TaxID=3096531 RepID=UPI002A6A3729|nr:type II secretion system protein [Massilia sp. CFBP9012]MDY0976339.1 type II secretion system protein [Massilia sp. CFBP9012]